MALDSSTTQNKERSLGDNTFDEVNNKDIKIEVLPLNPMVFYPAFPHIVERILDQFDKGSLRSCRQVSKSSMDSIDNRNLLWNEIVKDEGDDEVFQYACENGHTKMLEMIFQKPTAFNIDYNAKDFFGSTAFHLACENGHLKIAEMLIKKSTEINIMLNRKTPGGWTAFHSACNNGHLKIAEMLIHRSTELNIKSEC